MSLLCLLGFHDWEEIDVRSIDQILAEICSNQITREFVKIKLKDDILNHLKNINHCIYRNKKCSRCNKLVNDLDLFIKRCDDIINHKYICDNCLKEIDATEIFDFIDRKDNRIKTIFCSKECKDKWLDSLTEAICHRCEGRGVYTTRGEMGDRIDVCCRVCKGYGRVRFLRKELPILDSNLNLII